jgi:hypothetical protein
MIGSDTEKREWVCEVPHETWILASYEAINAALQRKMCSLCPRLENGTESLTALVVLIERQVEKGFF